MRVLLLLVLILSSCGPSRPLTEKDLHRKAADNYLAGKAFLEQGDLKSALARFRVAQSLDPANEINRIAIGLTLLNLSRFAEAETAFKDLMPGSSDRFAVVFGLARAQFGLSRFAAALSGAQEALLLEPGSDDARVLIIRSLSRLDAHDDALSALQQLQQSSPGDSRLPALKADVVARRDAWAARVTTPEGKIKLSGGISRQDLAFLFSEFFPKFMMEGSEKQLVAVKDLPAEEPYSTACRSAISRGLIEVLPDETFRPDFVLKRGDFAIYLSRLIAQYRGELNPEGKYVGQASSPFPDLPQNHWAFGSVMLVTELSIMKSNSDGTFGLSEPMAGSAALASFAVLKDYLENTAIPGKGNQNKKD